MMQLRIHLSLTWLYLSSCSRALNLSSGGLGSIPPLLHALQLACSGADFWQNRGFNDKSVKTSKIAALDLLIKIGYGPIA